MKRFMVGSILLGFRAGRPAIAGRMARLLGIAILACASSVHGQVIEKGGFPVKDESVSGESFSLSCPSRLVVRTGEAIPLSCTAAGVPEEGVRYEWESLSGGGLSLLSDAQVLAPLFSASLSGEGAEYAYRLTATGPGAYAAASVTVTVGSVPGQSAGPPGLQDECDPLGIPDEPGEGCVPREGGPEPFGYGFEGEGEFLFPEAPGAPDREGGFDSQALPRLECPVAVFLEELETGVIECHAWDASGEEYLEYFWEPVGSTTRNWLDNPRLFPEDSPTPSVIAPEAPAYETLESFLSGETTLRYRYRLTATSRATGLSSSQEVEVYVSSSRPVVYCPLEVVVEEGEAVTLDCEGADPLSFRMDYDEEAASALWEWEGLWGTSTAPLAGMHLSSPLFTAPAGSAGEEYHYIASMTTSASGASRTARRRVTVKVVDAEDAGQAAKANAPSIECEDAEIYEATENFTLNCTATDAPDGATYSWTGTDIADRLSATTVLTPTFYVPPNVDADTDYDYTVTMTAGGVDQASEDVTVTVLEKLDIYCSLNAAGTGSERLRDDSFLSPGETFRFDPCSLISGAPDGSEYEYAWIGVGTVCCTPEIALAHLDRTDIRNPVFTAPAASPYDGPMFFTYRITISARNADSFISPPYSVGLGFSTDRRPQLGITCSNDSYEVDAGAPDFSLECTGSGAWESGYNDFPYSWQWSPTGNLTNHDTRAPTFDVPDNVPRDTTYTYTATVSARNHLSAQATVEITVRAQPSIACTSPVSVYEGDPDFSLTCAARHAPDGVSYAWTSPSAPRTRRD